MAVRLSAVRADRPLPPSKFPSTDFSEKPVHKFVKKKVSFLLLLLQDITLVFKIAVLSCLVKGNRRFGETYHLRFYDRKIRTENKQCEASSKEKLLYSAA
jgi:hypothetical protein